MQCTEKGIENASINMKNIYIFMFIHQSMNSFFIYQCTDYKLNLVAFISEVLYVYYVIDNNGVVSMETHRFPFSITHQLSFSMGDTFL